jgi:hypothetical protein
MPRLKRIAIATLAALFTPALFAMNTQNAPMSNAAVPGTLNYVEGSAQLNGQPITQSSVGMPTATLQAGQVLSTGDSRAEVLLTPGVYLRLGHNSAVRMLSPDITDTAIAVERGRADVEVDQLFPENRIHVVVDDVPVQLIKPGIYEFSANRDSVMVFSGMAVARRANKKWLKVKENHALDLAELSTARPTEFNAKEQETSGLYRWSSLRSDYLAEDNQQMAGEYGGGNPGWYWDPYALDYTFMGPYGFYSPFGWGFAPFGWMGGMGWGYPGFYGGGYYGGGYGGGRFIGPHGRPNLPAGGFGGASRGGFRGNALRGGGEMGGFHGGGGFGGFHGGGMGGGGVNMGAGGFGGGGHGR